MSPALLDVLSALSGAPNILSGSDPKLITITPIVLLYQSSDIPPTKQAGHHAHPRVWYSPDIDAFKFTLHIISDNPPGFLWPKYIFLRKHKCLLSIFKLWAHVARILTPVRQLWYVSRVLFTADIRTRWVISRYASSTADTARNWCSHWNNLYLLFSTWSLFSFTRVTGN